MQAQDLRIGNYIKWIDNVVKVDLEIMKLVSENPEWAKPIEITDEILLGCGFEIEQESDISTVFYIDIDVNELFELFKDGNGKYFVSTNYAEYLLFSLNSIHELQNAYYLATKEELEINLETL